ncbi:MAG: ATP-binding protein [Candidatus Wallbacteria bacterium]|nr:ATP-binding protein [Candidatus Wallbacteria bacterium]
MIQRTLKNHLLKMAEKFPVITITGPRQSGKTTLVKSAFPDYAYSSMENLDERAMALEDPRGFLEPHSRTGIIIDEAQKAPELFSYLQEIVDSSGTMGRFVLTGSQNFLLMAGITQSLAGRVSIQHLLPFNLEELGRMVELEKTSLDNLLFSGMSPALHDRKIAPPDYYPDYLETYVERDVRSLKNIGDLATFTKFLKLCAGRTGQLLNLASIGNETGINAKTARSWLSILEASFIVYLLKPWYKNLNKRIVKSPKLYFYDTGLACSLLGLSSEGQLGHFYLRGNLFENFIISEFLKSAVHNGKKLDAYFWQDSTGNEIDLVVEKGPEIHAIEIKSGATVNRDFFRNLEKFKKYSGLSRENSNLVYGGDKNLSHPCAAVISWRKLTKSSLFKSVTEKS